MFYFYNQQMTELDAVETDQKFGQRSWSKLGSCCCSVQTVATISFLYVCMVNTIYLLSFVETPRKFIIAELSMSYNFASPQQIDCKNALQRFNRGF